MAANIEKKSGIFKKLGGFFGGYSTELKKIVWPTQKTVWKNTGIVLLMIFIMGVFVFALDSGLLYALGQIMSVSPRTTASVPSEMSEEIPVEQMPEIVQE